MRLGPLAGMTTIRTTVTTRHCTLPASVAHAGELEAAQAQLRALPERYPDGDMGPRAAFALAWQKVGSLAGIDAFIYHRHVDHAPRTSAA